MFSETFSSSVVPEEAVMCVIHLFGVKWAQSIVEVAIKFED